MVARFVSQGYPAYLVRGQGAAAEFYRVRIGAFPARKAAEDVAKKLEGTEGLKPWIVKEIPETGSAVRPVSRTEEISTRR
jgi:cell division septation protein DedD